MPRGRYLVDGEAEDFSCAAGPSGWRYTSPVLDLVLDRSGRTVRALVRCGHREVRGGRTELGMTWLDTSREPPRERHAEADGFAGSSPGLLVAAARRVAPAGQGPASATLRQVLLSSPNLAPLLVTRRWSRAYAQTHEAPSRPLLVETWQVDDLDAGTRGTVHLAGDVVLAADFVDAGGDGAHEPGTVELDDLEAPPTAIPE